VVLAGSVTVSPSAAAATAWRSEQLLGVQVPPLVSAVCVTVRVAAAAGAADTISRAAAASRARVSMGEERNAPGAT
jgi:hypothetical protein